MDQDTGEGRGDRVVGVEAVSMVCRQVNGGEETPCHLAAAAVVTGVEGEAEEGDGNGGAKGIKSGIGSIQVGQMQVLQS